MSGILGRGVGVCGLNSLLRTLDSMETRDTKSTFPGGTLGVRILLSPGVPDPGVHGGEVWSGAQGAPLDARTGTQWPLVITLHPPSCHEPTVPGPASHALCRSSLHADPQPSQLGSILLSFIHTEHPASTALVQD